MQKKKGTNMGKFNNKISAEYNPPRKWVLERALSYRDQNIDVDALEKVGVECPAHRITCKKGFTTDLASVPRGIWQLIAPWDIARAAIIHDLLYLRIRQYRAKHPANALSGKVYTKVVKLAKKAADDVFLMAMKDAIPEVPSWKINMAYYAVVTCGRWSIIPRESDDEQL
jgi:hypothetical protein